MCVFTPAYNKCCRCTRPNNLNICRILLTRRHRTRSSTGVNYEQSELVSAILALHSQGFASGHHNVQRSKTGQRKIVPTPSPTGGDRVLECSSPNVQPSTLPSGTQESLFTSTISTHRSVSDGPDRRDSSETPFTEASIQSSMPLTPILSGSRSGIKREDEHKVRDQGLSKDPNNPRLQGAQGQSSQNQSIPEAIPGAKPTMEAWMVMPRVSRADGGCGYDLRWRMNVWPLDSTEMRRLVRGISWWGKPDISKQFASLTSMEREVVNHYLAPRNNALNDDVTVKGVGFRPMEPTVEPNTRMPWRSIQVLIARTRPRRTSFTCELITQTPPILDEPLRYVHGGVSTNESPIVVQGYAEVPKSEEVGIGESKAKGEGPFAGLTRLLVVADGIVHDQYGKTAGLVVEGDPKDLVGRAVDEDGDIFDESGNIIGRAKPIDQIPIGSSAPVEDRATKRFGDVSRHDPIQEQVIENENVGAERMQHLQLSVPNMASHQTYPKYSEVEFQDEEPEIGDSRRMRRILEGHYSWDLDFERDVPEDTDGGPYSLEPASPQDFPEETVAGYIERPVAEEAEIAPDAEEPYEVEAERIIQGLLGRYTTLYDQ